MHEPQSGQFPADTATEDGPLLNGPAVALADQPTPFPGTAPNSEEHVEAEPVVEAPRPRRRLRWRFRLAGRRPGSPRAPMGWNTRFKVAVVLSFLILVSVLIVNRVTRGRSPAPSNNKGDGPPTLLIRADRKAAPSPDSKPQSPPPEADAVAEAPREEVQPPVSPPAEHDPTPEPTARIQRVSGDGLIQASNSALSPPLPADGGLSVAEASPQNDSLEDEPPLPATEPTEPETETGTDTVADQTEAPPEAAMAFAGLNPPVRVATADAMEEPAPTEIEPPDAPAETASLDAPGLAAFQEPPLPSIGMDGPPDTSPAAITEPDRITPADPNSESLEVVSQASPPPLSAEPATTETSVVPPIDSPEGLAGPAMPSPGESAPESEPVDPTAPDAPGSLLAMPTPSTDPSPDESPVEAGSPTSEPAEPTTAPELVAESAEPTPSQPPAPTTPVPPTAAPTPVAAMPAPATRLAATPEASSPTAAEPVTSSAEPAALVLSEVPKRHAESVESREVVGGRIEPVTHVVRRGENFFTIARYYYGSGRFYRALWKANAETVPKIDELYVGSSILVPAPENLDRSYIDAPEPRPTVGSSPSSSIAPGDPSRPDRDDHAERTAGSRSEVELTLPKVVPASARREPLSFPSEPILEPIPAPRSGMRVHIVQPYETLRSIAREELGDSRWESELLKLNAEQVDDPYDLAVGLRLRLPEGTRRD